MEYSANLIAENMISQCDEDGFSSFLMDCIIDFKKDLATVVSKEDMHVITKRGQRRLRKTTSGWKILVRWKDKTESWIPLKDMKESHP